MCNVWLPGTYMFGTKNAVDNFNKSFFILSLYIFGEVFYLKCFISYLCWMLIILTAILCMANGFLIPFKVNKSGVLSLSVSASTGWFWSWQMYICIWQLTYSLLQVRIP